MGIRSLQALAVVAAISGAFTPIQSDAARPTATVGAINAITKPATLPLGIAKPQVTVVMQLEGDPVALQQEAAGRKLEQNERSQIKSSLRARQDALRSGIQGAGGTVIANYQAAYNGIKVRVAVDKVAQLAALPGVLAVRPVRPMSHDNVVGIPLIGTPAVWQSLGLHGEHIKVAIIDTGIDYTHANFGGPGTVAAYTAAHAAQATAADPKLFGPKAPRVKGGIDLVGDDYNADPNADDYQPIPHPDPNPLDCEGHGSHVAGTAAGSGVTADGKTYAGKYNASTVSGNQWTIGPGVAPKADLYAIRVFGCTGSTDVVVDAIEWAVDNDMDVINMSLGSDFGTKDTADAEATTNAARAGVVVVISAGNSGPGRYLVGSPGSASGAITVAAMDPTATFAGATLTLPGGGTIAAQNSNNAPFTNGTTYQVAVLRDGYPSGPVALGCSQAEYDAYPGGAAALAGKLVVTQRNVCSRVARAIFAQKNGAAASAMIDNTTGYPPVEGKITGSAETGDFTVTIPFFGIRGLAATNTSDGGKLRLADGGNVTATNSQIANPNYLGFASFSSAGPRSTDSHLKPDISAPGVSTVSTASGTGNQATTLSGTSMASPHVAGVAALTRQAHPDWNVASIMASIINTGDPAQIAGYKTSRGGTGLVQPGRSTITQVTARSDERRFPVALNFGFQEMTRDFHDRKSIKLENKGNTKASFFVSQVLATGSAHTVSLDRSVVTVHPHSTTEVGVSLTVPVATVGQSSDGAFHEVAGVIQFAPVNGNDNLGTTLRVPYYLVGQSISDVSTKIGRLNGNNPSTTATVTNRQGAVAGDADFYAWGLSDRREPGRVSNDVRAVGAQAFPWDATQQIVVFGVNTFDRWSNASTSEFDIYVDVDGDGVDDYIVVGADQGAITTGTNSGQMGSFVFSTRSAGSSENFLATAPTDSSIAELPFLTSQMCRLNEPCLSATNPRMTYHIVAFDVINGGVKEVPGTAKFNAWASAISQGGFVGQLAPRASDDSTVIQVNSAEWKLTPAKGLMVITIDNKAGTDEAQLIDVNVHK